MALHQSLGRGGIKAGGLDKIQRLGIGMQQARYTRNFQQHPQQRYRQMPARRLHVQCAGQLLQHALQVGRRSIQGEDFLADLLLIKGRSQHQLGEKIHADQRQPVRRRTGNRPKPARGQIVDQARQRLRRQDMPTAAMAADGGRVHQRQ